MTAERTQARTLVFSHRNIAGGTALYRCPHYEFEDVISRIDSVDLVAPAAAPSPRRHRLAKKVAYHTPLVLNPGIRKLEIPARYDLFFTICGDATDLLMVKAAVDWKKHCAKSVCLIDELWISQIDAFRRYYPLLSQFDVVLLYYNQSIKPVGERLRTQCAYLPPGVDALRFCPYPDPPRRTIDVYSIGRRSETTHRKLLDMAAREGVFYLHDSIAGGSALNAAEHRTLFINVAKRSRYFLVNPGLIDRPEIRRDQVEIGNRYFEGAASGTIMIGQRPDTEAFHQLFDWPEAVINMAYDSAGIDAVIHELDRQPERQEMMRRTNVTQALQRHDWAYRWEKILGLVGLEVMPQLLNRKQELRNRARSVPAATMTQAATR